MRGERLGAEHLEPLAALLGDPRVGATLGGALSRTQTEGILDWHAAHWEREGFGYWLFRDVESGAPVGRGGLQRTVIARRDEVEVGWAVAPERWGQGLATEMGAAAVGVAFGALGLSEVVAFTLPGNTASRRVMEKLGFAFERETDYKGWPHVVYRLHAA
jgi:ribosomal-protein-alanine N-acetyltransferase